MLEFEKKIILTREEYFTLVTTLCKFTQPIIQTNYYFDTKDLAMNKKGITCRIRGKKGEFKATIKNHCENCSVENTIYIKNEFDPNAFNSMGLHLVGSLVTERIIAYTDEFCEMVFDRNTFLNFTDFELEVEYLEGHEEKAVQLINRVAEILLAKKLIVNTEQFNNRISIAKSKSERFFEHIKI